MGKLDMTVETTHRPQSMEEVQKAVKEFHLYSYQSSAMNVEQSIQWNGQSSAVSVEFEEWLCEHILESRKKTRNWNIYYVLLHGKLEHAIQLDFMLQTSFCNFLSAIFWLHNYL